MKFSIYVYYNKHFTQKKDLKSFSRSIADGVVKSKEESREK